MGWHWELGSSPALSRFKSLLLALPLQLFWVVRLLETGCCPGELAKFVCMCQPAREELIDLSAS